MSLTPGTRLGPYEIGEQLGAGGMGEVYRARDTRLDRSVAIKVLPRHLADLSELRERFEREARTVSSLNHPHICTLYDIGSQDGVDFLVMEYLEGTTLADRLAKGALPFAEALALATQIADALDKAHRQGITHRDLKPGNVMLTSAGAKVLDFGLAKRSAGVALAGGGTAIGASALPTQGAPLTVEGTILGTLQYMAPEQLEGREADPRADIFAFGAMLHEMVTGQRAFEGKSHVSLIAAIVDRDPPPVSSLLPVSPPQLDHLVKHCLSKNPDKRWQAMADVLLELKLIADLAPRTEPAATSHRNRHHLFFARGAAGLLLVSTIVLTLALLRPRSVPPPTPKISVDITTPPASSPNQFAVSPSGSHLVAVVNSDKGPMLWLRALEHLNGQVVPGTADPAFPFWSPDGRFIGFFTGGKLKRVDIQGAPPQTLTDAASGHGGAWNGNDVIVFAPTANGPLFRVSAAGGVAVKLTELDTSRQEFAHRHPHFLPDGQHFIYLAVSTRSENSGIYLASLGSAERTRLVSASHKAMFAPPEHVLYVRDNTLMAQRLDPARLTLAGDPAPIAEDVGNFLPNGAGGFAVSASGLLVYRTGGANANAVVSWFDRQGKSTEPLTQPAPFSAMAISPDLGRLAIARSDTATSADIWLQDLTRRTSTRLTADPGINGDPVWSPDGSRIAFSAIRVGGAGATDLYVKGTSGVGKEEAILKSDHPKFPLDWSQDGRFLLFLDRDPQTNLDLWALPMAGEGKPQPIVQSKFPDYDGRFSPDGRWLAFVSDESGRPEVYVQGFPTATSRAQISTGGGRLPHWRRDGKELYFISAERTDAMAVDVSLRTDGVVNAGVPHKLFALPPNTFNGWDVAPDGQRFLINLLTQQTATARPLTVMVNWTKR